MNLKRVTLVFETCEFADIPSEMISYLMMSGVTTTQVYRGEGEIETNLDCKEFALHILKEAGGIPMPWSKDEENNPLTLAQRIIEKDVVAIVLNYGDREDSYTVSWNSIDGFTNEEMTVTEECDEIHISIG